jgi:hypothetical protein
MRQSVLSIAFASLFLVLPALPIAATELECSNEPSQPADAFTQIASERHPDLDKGQVTSMAKMYELAYQQQQLANNEALPAQDRAFAERTKQLAMRIAAIQLNTFESLPQLESVQRRMEAEKAVGLMQVSAELMPDVRHAARTMLALGLIWSDLSNVIVQLSADRFLAVADDGNVTDAINSAQHTVCTLQWVVDTMESAVKFFPNAAALAYVETLNY